MSDLRCYLDISTGTLPSPSEAQWVLLINQVKTKPLSAAIIAAARACQNYLSASKRSYGTGQALKHTLGGFEIEDSQVAALTDVLNTQAATWGIAGSVSVKFAGVFTKELQQSTTDLGYTVNQSLQLAVTLVNPGNFGRDAAIAAVDQYLVDNDAVWHAPA